MTDPTDARPPETDPASPSGDGADLARRRFFRQLAGDLFHGAAGVVGAAQALQRVSAEAAGAILDPSSVAPAAVAAVPVVPAYPTGFRTPFRETPGVLHLVDQRKLPDVLEEYRVRSASEAAYAIREMIVRGAPAIGQVGAIGLTLTADNARTTRPYARRATLRGAAKTLINARPTAVNLRWAVERVMAAYEAVGDLSEDGDAIADAMRAEADTIIFETTEDHGRLALSGLEALEALGFPEDRPLRILTHCNTGPLACGQYGTALGVVQAAHHGGRAVHVWVDETRPYLQGARLTAWELAQAGVPHTLIPDVAAGHLMANGEVDVILVGADRIAANGDTANKVGTYALAVLAARHAIPFFVAAPISTVDLGTTDGAAIPIEERKANEVLFVRGVSIAPPDTDVRNPAFDVTPSDLITGIVSDEGVIRAPYPEGLAEAVARREVRRAAAPGFGALAAAAAAAPVAAEPAVTDAADAATDTAVAEPAVTDATDTAVAVES